MKPLPFVYSPFDPGTFEEVKTHVREVRRAFDAPGSVYHDNAEAPDNKFFRWFWHQLPVLVAMHNDPDFIAAASDIFGERVKPSYAFLSLYGPSGICPPHTDRPQCKYTTDLLIDQDGEPWPIYIHETQDEQSPASEVLLKPGEAVCYSGTGSRHYRNPINLTKGATFANLAFFHWVPVAFVGPLA